MNGRTTVILAATLGGLAVAIGAFGAHAFPGWLASQGASDTEVARRLNTLEIGVRYQMYHALALLALGLWQVQRVHRTGTAAVWWFLAGIGLFSGGLYVFSITGMAAFARIVPIGGVSLVIGWIALAITCGRGEATAHH